MPLTIYGHTDIYRHDAAANHVAMAANRIERIHAEVRKTAGARLVDARFATIPEVLRIHATRYVSLLQETEDLGAGMTVRLNDETILNRNTWRAMLRSAGAVCQAVDAAIADRSESAFCAGYAGHHAKAGKGEGFCFINSVAIGAAHALSRGLERIAVLDIDTHSGDGTVQAFMGEPRVCFVETYQAGFPGDFLKAPLPHNMLRAQCSSRAQWEVQWSQLLAHVKLFDPQLVLVSAGFDAHKADPLSSLNLEDRDYAWIGRQIAGLGAPVVATLEGGYSVEDTARCARLFCEQLAG